MKDICAPAEKKKCNQCHVGDPFQPHCFIVWEMGPRCLADLVNNVSRQCLYDIVASQLLNTDTRTWEGRVCDLYLMLWAVDILGHYLNGIVSLLGGQRMLCLLLVIKWQKDHMAIINSCAWKCLFFPCPEPSTQTYEVSVFSNYSHQLSQLL